MTTAPTAAATAAVRRFRPYAEYRDSGVEWLGEIPAHWEVKKLTWITKCLDGKRIPLNSEERSRMQGEYPYWGANSIVDHVDQWLFDEELVLLGEDGAPFFDRTRPVAFPIGGKIWVNNHAHVLRPLGVNPRFLAEALNCVDYRAFIDGSTRDKLTQGDMNQIAIQQPPLSEQRAIAAFLDRETAKIDALIAKKERLIELLQEKRSALITQAITKGLDPNAPMKDSGVEWLGEIPAHWEVKKWRYCCHIAEGQVAPDDLRYRDFIMIAPNHIESGTGRILLTETADEQGAISGKYLVKPGDIIYSKIRPALNKACIATGHWLCSADMYPVEITARNFGSQYLLYFILSEPFVRLMVDESMRVAMPKVNREKLAGCPLLIPSPAEQDAIVAHLDRETRKIDALIAKVAGAIDRLKELRTALISAAVTGKIDVREDAT